MHKEIIYRQTDKKHSQANGDVEYLFLDSSLRGIRAAGLPESRSQAAAAALLQQDQAGDGGRDYDLKDGDNSCHRIELTIIIINVVASNGQMPWMRNSKTSASASQTINISITKLNKFKVKTRKGRDSIFSIGAIPKFNKAIANPPTAKICQPPKNSTPGTNRAAANSANALPMVKVTSFANIWLILSDLIWNINLF